MKKVLAGTVLIASLVLTACTGGTGGTVACKPVENGVAVCLDGKPLEVSTKTKFHAHEGFYYGPAEETAKLLGTKAEVAADKKSVTVNGKVITIETNDKKGVHQHEDIVYVPVKQIAEAAGLKVSVDTTKHVVSINK